MVWCPKYRRGVVGGRVAARLDELVDEIAGDSLAEVAGRLNGRSWRVLRSELAWLGRKRVLWSKSYVAVSVGYVSVATVGRSIERRWDGVA